MDIEYLKKNIDREWGYRRAEELRVQDLKNRTHGEWLEELPYVHYVREPTGYLFQEAAELQKVLHEHGITFCFIGGIPLQCWGEVRQTNDVDLTIFAELGDEPDVLEVLDAYLESRVEDTRDMFLLGRMYLGRSPKGKQIDISIGFTPYERRMMERAVDIDYGRRAAAHLFGGRSGCTEDGGGQGAGLGRPETRHPAERRVDGLGPRL